MTLFAALLTPLLAFLGAGAGVLVARAGAREQDRRWRREESLRMLRWALELAITRESEARQVGWVILEALARAELLQTTEQGFLDAVTDLRVSGRMADE